MPIDWFDLLNTIFSGLGAVSAILQTICTCLAFPTIILSIVYAMRQTRLLAEGTRASVYNSINSQMLELDRFFVENPDLKPYFYEGKEISETDENYLRVANVAEWIFDFMDNVFTLARFMPEYPWRDTWYVYFKDLLKNKVLRRFWNQRKSWYAGSIKRIYPSELWDTFNQTDETYESASPSGKTDADSHFEV